MTERVQAVNVCTCCDACREACGCEAAERRVANLETRVRVLECNRVCDAARIRRLEKWEDTVTSALPKRLWWLLLGFCFSRLGRWYPAPWNASAAEYDE